MSGALRRDDGSRMPVGFFLKDETAAIADRILANENLDLVDAAEFACFFLSPVESARLRRMLDLCPVHGCDVEICADDEVDECAEART